MAKILITDDSSFMRTMIKSALSSVGHVCYEADNGATMLEAYKKIRPDIVTLDITMNVMDGLSALKRLTELDPYAKVIMCTAMGQQPMVLDAIRFGAKDFLVKPFQPSAIINSVNKLL